MERKVFLDRCKAESLKPKSQTVEVSGTLYRPKSYILGFDTKGKPIHTVMLQDLNTNCVVYASLDKVE